MIVISGGFDPLHIGHIRLFKDAARFGKLTVILNTDAFLKKKKGYIVLPYKERAEIIRSIGYVDKVVQCIDTDQTVNKTLLKVKPDMFGRGGDKSALDNPEKEICKKMGIKIKHGLGGKKVRSSSKMLKYLPTTADLIDRLCILTLKSIKTKDDYKEEIDNIMHDLDLKGLGGKLVRAIQMNAIANEVIWENEAEVRNTGKGGESLKYTHSMNGVRSNAKNVISQEMGERKDFKVNCLAEIGENGYNWNI